MALKGKGRNPRPGVIVLSNYLAEDRMEFELRVLKHEYVVGRLDIEGFEQAVAACLRGESVRHLVTPGGLLSAQPRTPVQRSN